MLTWNAQGVLPPILPGQPGHSPNRSPYPVSLASVVKAFGSTPQRIKILQGLMDYRSHLHQSGAVKGFQWLDGSFMENIEATASRPPNDIDVVTFFHLPPGVDEPTFFQANQHLLSSILTKPRFHVDAYASILGEPTDFFHVKEISYWYSMWSHNRRGIWKGFLQVDLSPTEDSGANLILGALIGQIGGQP